MLASRTERLRRRGHGNHFHHCLAARVSQRHHDKTGWHVNHGHGVTGAAPSTKKLLHVEIFPLRGVSVTSLAGVLDACSRNAVGHCVGAAVWPCSGDLDAGRMPHLGDYALCRVSILSVSKILICQIGGEQ